MNSAELSTEIETCHSYSKKSLFVFGFARSGTAILGKILNANSQCFMTGEANFYLNQSIPRFRDSFNEMHQRFGNQISKLTYAPDFIPKRKHYWWEYYHEASKYYDYVGDKIALSHYHLGECPPTDLMSFFEARFFDAKYIFTVRSPIQTILSACKLFSIADQRGMEGLISGWLDFIRFWSHCIQIFPSTITLIFRPFCEEDILRLGEFLGIDLSPSLVLIDRNAVTLHKGDDNAKRELIDKYGVRLNQIFEKISLSLELDPVVREAHYALEEVVTLSDQLREILDSGNH